MKTLNKKLIKIFVVFSLSLILITNLSLKFVFNNSFNEYIRGNIEDRINEINSKIQRVYTNHGFSKDLIEDIGMEALEGGFIIKVYDNNGGVIWDATNHNMTLCTNMLLSMEENMGKLNNNLKGEYVENETSLKISDEVVGKLIFGYYGPIYYTNSEILLYENLNSVFMIIGAIAIIISVGVGVLISRKISSPILEVRDRVYDISMGNFENKIDYKGDVLEINSMVESINKMGELLEEQREFRKDLIRDVSHEIRTPITTVSGQLEGIIDGIFEPTKERIESIFVEMERLNRLLGSLSKLNDFDGGIEVVKDLKNVDDTISYVVSTLEKEFIHKNITCTLNLKGGLAYFDEDRIIQALLNVFVNGIKYTRENGRMRVSSYRKEEGLYITIEDNGIGIPKNALDKVFNRFYRVDDSRNRKTGGSGLGLAITKEIILAHSGNISVESEENIGTKIEIFLP